MVAAQGAFRGAIGYAARPGEDVTPQEPMKEHHGITVQAVLSSVHDTMSAVQMAVDGLDSRLAPVVRPLGTNKEQAVDAPIPEPVNECALIRDLCILETRMLRTVDRINELCERVQL